MGPTITITTRPRITPIKTTPQTTTTTSITKQLSWVVTQLKLTYFFLRNFVCFIHFPTTILLCPSQLQWTWFLSLKKVQTKNDLDHCFLKKKNKCTWTPEKKSISKLNTLDPSLPPINCKGCTRIYPLQINRLILGCTIPLPSHNQKMNNTNISSSSCNALLCIWRFICYEERKHQIMRVNLTPRTLPQSQCLILIPCMQTKWC